MKTEDMRFGFEGIPPEDAAPQEGRGFSDLDRAAAKLGFVQREPAEVAIRRQRGTERTVHQFTMRVMVASSNKFVLWCERERLSYREGFERLVGLLDRET